MFSLNQDFLENFDYISFNPYKDSFFVRLFSKNNQSPAMFILTGIIQTKDLMFLLKYRFTHKKDALEASKNFRDFVILTLNKERFPRLVKKRRSRSIKINCITRVYNIVKNGNKDVSLSVYPLIDIKSLLNKTFEDPKIEQNEARKRIEMALKLIKNNFTIPETSELTGFSKADILSIDKQNKIRDFIKNAIERRGIL